MRGPKALFHRILYNTVLALSSWEGKISDEDLDKVAEVAPLMKVFGYKPEVHKGAYDQFISNTSQLTHLRYLTAEYKFKYVNRHKDEVMRKKVAEKFGTVKDRYQNWGDFQNTLKTHNPNYDKWKAKAFQPGFLKKDEF